MRSVFKCCQQPLVLPEMAARWSHFWQWCTPVVHQWGTRTVQTCVYGCVTACSSVCMHVLHLSSAVVGRSSSATTSPLVLISSPSTWSAAHRYLKVTRKYLCWRSVDARQCDSWSSVDTCQGDSWRGVDTCQGDSWRSVDTCQGDSWRSVDTCQDDRVTVDSMVTLVRTTGETRVDPCQDDRWDTCWRLSEWQLTACWHRAAAGRRAPSVAPPRGWPPSSSPSRSARWSATSTRPTWRAVSPTTSGCVAMPTNSEFYRHSVAPSTADFPVFFSWILKWKATLECVRHDYQWLFVKRRHP